MVDLFVHFIRMYHKTMSTFFSAILIYSVYLRNCVMYVSNCMITRLRYLANTAVRAEATSFIIFDCVIIYRKTGYS